MLDFLMAIAQLHRKTNRFSLSLSFFPLSLFLSLPTCYPVNDVSTGRLRLHENFLGSPRKLTSS